MSDIVRYVELYVDKQMSLTEVSKEVGKAISTVRYHLLKAGYLRSQKDARVLACTKGKMSQRRRSHTVSEDAKCRMSIAAKARWVGKAKGFTLKPNGYVECTMGEHKSRGQHRVIMELHIGRPLLPDEVVHHIDGDRANNAIENLQLMTRAEHASHHAHENHPNRKRNKNGSFA